MASSDTKYQQSERRIHDMMSKLMDRLVSLGQGTSEHGNNHNTHHDADQGVRIITLAGENNGATMKAVSLDELDDTQGMIYNDENLMTAYTNSNYQTVNNSIMLEGSCSAEDPGVHIVISDNLDDDSSSDDSDTNSDTDSEESDKEDKKGKKGKKKESKKKKEGKKNKEEEKKGKKKKETSKKEHHSESEKEEEGKHTDQ
jgi:hypothetical protein